MQSMHILDIGCGFIGMDIQGGWIEGYVPTGDGMHGLGYWSYHIPHIDHRF